MMGKDFDIVSLIEKSFEHSTTQSVEEIGTVIKVGDGICRIFGLKRAVYGELITFEGGNSGIVLDLDEDFVSVVLFDHNIPVVEQEVARRTGDVFRVPVGNALIGRVVSAMGEPLDALGPIKHDALEPIERNAPGIIERTPVTESLETGLTVIDALIPIGKGQRELIIGNRSTGKTAIVIDTILHQRGRDVICVYVSIGHKQSNTAKLIDTLEKNNALEYTIIVDADAQETALKQFIAPYTACAISEYLRAQGRDVLIIYDDLSNHAIAYRELSLLLRRPPGREAYPGDIFYIHSRLLERAGRIAPEYGGGSLTALPIIQTQGDDISAYIPTNLISITDGQIFLDANLFNSGIRPAVNLGLSISRVGGAAQTKALKKVAGQLKLELAQYEELQAFAQFGSELDKSSQRAIDRGRHAIEILKQGRQETYSFVDQTIFLFLQKEKLLDSVPLKDVKQFVTQCASFVHELHREISDDILATKDLSSATAEKLKRVAHEFKLMFSAVP